MKYFLPVKRAVEKVREHVELVKKYIGRPLHEVPILDIKLAIVNTLKDHPDFQMLKSAQQTPYLKPKIGEDELYADYEIGHHLLIDRLISKLRAEGKLQKQRENDVRAILGELYHNPPKSCIKKQITAINRLERRLGAQKTDELLKTIRAEWISQGMEVAQHPTIRHMSGDEVSDVLHNPTTNVAMDGLFFAEEGERPVKAVKRILSEYMASKSSSWYKTR